MAITDLHHHGFKTALSCFFDFLCTVFMVHFCRNMANSKEELERKKRLAYTLFVDNGFEQKVIASITGISEKSISSWKQKDRAAGRDWDEDRMEARTGFDKERKRIKKHINNIFDEIEKRKAPENVPNAAEGDTINKLSVAAKNLQTEISFAQKSEAGKLFISYVQTVHGQEKCIEIVELWHEFLMSTS
jgi:hypothetical protein